MDCKFIFHYCTLAQKISSSEMSALKVSGRVTGILMDEASDESKRFWVCGFGEGIDCRFFRGRVEVPGVFDLVPSTRDFRRAEIFATGVFSFLVFL